MNKVYLISEHQLLSLTDMLCKINRSTTPLESTIKISNIINALAMLEYVKPDDTWLEVNAVISNLMRRDVR